MVVPAGAAKATSPCLRAGSGVLAAAYSVAQPSVQPPIPGANCADMPLLSPVGYV